MLPRAQQLLSLLSLLASTISITGSTVISCPVPSLICTVTLAPQVPACTLATLTVAVLAAGSTGASELGMPLTLMFVLLTATLSTIRLLGSEAE